MFDPPLQPANPRSLRVGLMGPPNAGKSALMNAILEVPISAVSPKVPGSIKSREVLTVPKPCRLRDLTVPAAQNKL